MRIAFIAVEIVAFHEGSDASGRDRDRLAFARARAAAAGVAIDAGATGGHRCRHGRRRPLLAAAPAPADREPRRPGVTPAREAIRSGGG